MNVFRAVFPNQVISCFGDVPWSLRSPGRFMCYVCFLAVHEGKPFSLGKLKKFMKKTLWQTLCVSITERYHFWYYFEINKEI